MNKLEEAGIGIGDFAMSLMDSGKISKKVQSPEIARPKELPVSEVDISETLVSTSMVDKVLNESFGLSNTNTRKGVQTPVLTEQELLQEKIVSLKEELVETINKLSSLVSEMAGMGMTTTQSIGTGYSTGNVTGKYRGRNKRSKVIKRTSN